MRNVEPTPAGAGPFVGQEAFHPACLLLGLRDVGPERLRGAGGPLDDLDLHGATAGENPVEFVD
jgi:hypothetical protein